MRVQVRKCPFTGKIFEEDKVGGYIAHLYDLRNKMKNERHLQNVKSNFAVWLAKERESITQIDMIVPWFLKNQRHIMDAHNAGCTSQYSFRSNEKFFPGDKFTEMVFERITFHRTLSNTHICPDSGVTNFSWDSAKPRGYIGWRIQVSGKCPRKGQLNHVYPYSSALNLVGIKTGTGGGGNDNWSYDASIFVDDWTGLKAVVRQMEEEEIIHKLKGAR